MSLFWPYISTIRKSLLVFSFRGQKICCRMNDTWICPFVAFLNLVEEEQYLPKSKFQFWWNSLRIRAALLKVVFNQTNIKLSYIHFALSTQNLINVELPLLTNSFFLRKHSNGNIFSINADSSEACDVFLLWQNLSFHTSAGITLRTPCSVGISIGFMPSSDLPYLN